MSEKIEHAKYLESWDNFARGKEAKRELGRMAKETMGVFVESQRVLMESAATSEVDFNDFISQCPYPTCKSLLPAVETTPRVITPADDQAIIVRIKKANHLPARYDNEKEETVDIVIEPKTK